MENEDRFPPITNENEAEVPDADEARRQLEHLRALLESESAHIKMPDSLSAENMLRLLDGIGQEGPAADADSENAENSGGTVTHADFKKKKKLTRRAALAACLAVAVIGIKVLGGERDITTPATSQAATAAESRIAAAPDEGGTAATYDEIYSMLCTLQQETESYYYAMVDGTMTVDDDAVTTDAAPSAGLSNSLTTDEVQASESVGDSASFAQGYTATNTQYSDVDEGDILKTDGEYFYHLRYDNDSNTTELVITQADTLEVLSRTKLDGYISGEVYITGDTLAIVYSDVWENDAPDDKVSDYLTEDGDTEVIVPDWYEEEYGSATSLLLYDISDRESPKASATFRQGGYSVSSRLADGVIYLVSNQYVDLWGVSRDSAAANVFPAVSLNGEGKILSTDSIFLPDSLHDSASYCIVSAYDISSGEYVTKAVLGSVDNIVMTGDTLLLASNIYDGSWMQRDTGITRFAVGGDDTLTYVSSGRVDGWIDGQFSLDVSDGLLRIATTTYNSDGETENGVYIYDEDMSLVGSVTGLASGERIYSVRYLGDTAYIVTFRETDPLFAVDLSDPENPTVLGQLKIPGFSEYLHPAGDGLLIGLGNSTATTSYGSVITNGIKLSLFDISDPADPKELDSVQLGNNGSYSEALSNHKAFMWDGANGRFGFPATLVRTYGATADNPWGTSSSTVFDGYLVYTYDENGFTRLGAVESSDSSDPFAGYDYTDTILRGVVIGDTLYTASEGGIDAWSYATFEKTGEVGY